VKHSEALFYDSASNILIMRNYKIINFDVCSLK